MRINLNEAEAASIVATSSNGAVATPGKPSTSAAGIAKKGVGWVFAIMISLLISFVSQIVTPDRRLPPSAANSTDPGVRLTYQGQQEQAENPINNPVLRIMAASAGPFILVFLAGWLFAWTGYAFGARSRQTRRLAFVIGGGTIAFLIYLGAYRVNQAYSKSASYSASVRQIYSVRLAAGQVI